MGARLDQVLAYLDREAVTELLLGVGHPVTLVKGDQHVALTKVPVTRPQFDALVEGSELERLIPEDDGSTPPLAVIIGERALVVRAGRRGEEIVLRIGRAQRTRSRTIVQPRTKSIDRIAQIKGATSPRAKPVTERAPNTKDTPTGPRTKTGTTSARTKSRSIAAKSMPLETIDAPHVKTMLLPTIEETQPIPMPFEVAAPPLLDSTRLERLATGKQLEQLHALVRQANERGGSDLHVATGRPVMVRVLGELTPLAESVPDVTALIEPLIEPHRARYESLGYIDLAIEGPAGVGRLRANVTRYQGGVRATFRLARATPPALQDIGLPRELSKVTMHHQGLVVIAGPSGHGKTTTLAALVEIINASRPFHIITVEDPVEIVFQRKTAVVSQREVGSHTKSFAAALKGSLREDPDVIVIGELRDRETVEIALTAAETGHLVLATMSTPSAAKTIDRLIDMFPPDDQSQVRASIAGALRAIVAQRLIPAADGSAMVAAVELLTGCLPLSAMIRDDKLYQLPNLMQRGRMFGMIRLDESLLELVRAGKISPEAALLATENKRELAGLLKTMPAPPPPAARKGLR